jgi:hypothetical protein
MLSNMATVPPVIVVSFSACLTKASAGPRLHEGLVRRLFYVEWSHSGVSRE